jgi:uncharacterized protein RhaS with RHS repeats
MALANSPRPASPQAQRRAISAIGYDALGRPAQVATTIDGTAYTTAAAYDGNGRLNQVTYPSGFVASYGYNSLGYANQLSDGGAQTFWTASVQSSSTVRYAGNLQKVSLVVLERL